MEIDENIFMSYVDCTVEQHYKIKELEEEKEKIAMENCILEDYKTDVRSLLTMNDLDNLEELDKKLNEYRVKLKDIKEVIDFDKLLELTGYAFKKRVKDIVYSN